MNEIISIAICDDEKIQVELLERYVENWAKENDIRVEIELFYNAESFDFAWSMDKKYNILLLDIEMPGKNGIELAKKIRKGDNLLNIIFITAISDYISEGYDVEAINYLIKPIKENKLYECLDRAFEKIPIEEKNILIDVEGETIRLIEKDILYIESFSHFVDIHTSQENYRVRKNIGTMEKILEQNSFIRCHRSYIVNLKHIKKIGKVDIVLDNDDLIPVSRRQYSNTNMAFIKYHGGRSGDK